MNDEICESFESAFERFIEYYGLEKGWSLTSALENHFGIGKDQVNKFKQKVAADIGQYNYNVGVGTIQKMMDGKSEGNARGLTEYQEMQKALRKAEKFKEWRANKRKEKIMAENFHKTYGEWTI